MFYNIICIFWSTAWSCANKHSPIQCAMPAPSLSRVTMESDMPGPTWTQSSALSVSTSPEQEKFVKWLFWFDFFTKKIMDIYFCQICLTLQFEIVFFLRALSVCALKDMEHEGRLQKACRCVQLAWKKLVKLLGPQSIEDTVLEKTCPDWLELINASSTQLSNY